MRKHFAAVRVLGESKSCMHALTACLLFHRITRSCLPSYPTTERRNGWGVWLIMIIHQKNCVAERALTTRSHRFMHGRKGEGYPAYLSTKYSPSAPASRKQQLYCAILYCKMLRGYEDTGESSDTPSLGEQRANKQLIVWDGTRDLQEPWLDGEALILITLRLSKGGRLAGSRTVWCTESD